MCSSDLWPITDLPKINLPPRFICGMGTTSSCFGELMIAHYLYCVNQPEKPLASQAVPWYTKNLYSQPSNAVRPGLFPPCRVKKPCNTPSIAAVFCLAGRENPLSCLHHPVMNTGSKQKPQISWQGGHQMRTPPPQNKKTTGPQGARFFSALFPDKAAVRYSVIRRGNHYGKAG